MLGWALSRAYESADTVGSSMVVFDAIDEGSADFYEAHRFTRLGTSLRLVMPIHTIGKLVGG